MGLLGDVGSFVSNIAGVVQNAFNGPGRQYRYQRKLMEKQAALNEEAAQANHARSLDLYDHQFQTQAGWDASTAQRARAEAAGIGKASLGAGEAQPVASAAGAGASAGASLGTADVAGPAGNMSASLSNLGSMFLQLKDLNSQIDLREAQANELESRSTMQVAQTAVNESTAALLDITADNEQVRGSLLRLQEQFESRTLESRVDLTESQADVAAQEVNRIIQEVESMKTSNQIKKLYGFKRARLECENLAAGVALAQAEAHDAWSRVGVNKEQAKYYSQLFLNGQKEGVKLDFYNDLNKALKRNMLTREQVAGLREVQAYLQERYNYKTGPLSGVEAAAANALSGAILFGLRPSFGTGTNTMRYGGTLRR